MIWLTVNAILVAIFLLMIFWQRYTIGKKVNLDSVLLEFREMRYETAGILVHRVTTKRGNAYENKELYDFLLLTTRTIDGFDMIKSDVLNFKSFKKIFMRIDSSYQSANFIDLETSELVHKYKARFVRNLFSAFKTIPFFRFRVIGAIFLSRIAIGLGFFSLKKYVDKVKHILETYEGLKKANYALSYLT